MATEQQQQLEVPAGTIFVTTYGGVRAETAQSLLMLQQKLISMGIMNVDIRFVHSTLVDKARNESVLALLQTKKGWMWFIDADMEFTPDIVEPMLLAAFHKDSPWDIVGGYCQLRGQPYLPTIDTGSGYWESHLPNTGVKEVIRTGGACMLIKRKVVEAMEFPWFGLRHAGRPLDIMTDFDNYCRMKFDGTNPFTANPAWDHIVKCAIDERRPPAAMDQLSTVGEDSNFCDKARALGFRIAVQTHAVMGHVDKKIIVAQDHIDAMNKNRAEQDALAGIAGD
jgi:hypothetical protein